MVCFCCDSVLRAYSTTLFSGGKEVKLEPKADVELKDAKTPKTPKTELEDAEAKLEKDKAELEKSRTELQVLKDAKADDSEISHAERGASTENATQAVESATKAVGVAMNASAQGHPCAPCPSGRCGCLLCLAFHPS